MRLWEFREFVNNPNLDPQTEVVVVLRHGAEAIEWIVRIRKPTWKGLLLIWLLKSFKDVDLHGWADNPHMHVGLDGKTMEMRISNWVIPIGIAKDEATPRGPEPYQDVPTPNRPHLPQLPAIPQGVSANWQTVRRP